MILVADCSALIALASCDGLHLLDALFGTVIVPEAVYREAVVGDKPEAQQLKEYLQGKVRKIDAVGSVFNYISTIGSLGVLLAAKQAGLIDQILPFVNKLASSDIYVSAALIATVMDIAGEEWPR